MFELRKIGFVKRVSALFLDAILLAVLTTGFMFILSLICNYSKEEELATQYFNEYEDFRKEYAKAVANEYGFTYEEKEDGDYVVKKNGEPSSLDAVMKKLEEGKGVSEDPKVVEAYSAYQALTPIAKVDAQYKYVYSLLFMMAAVGILLSYVVLEFIIPIILKNGQTVGKKVFAIGLVRADCVKITTLALFTRTFLGKFAIETMFPVLLVFLFFFGGLGILALILFAAITLLNVIIFFATKNRMPIHDLLAGTVVVDMKLQMIFQSEEELIEKKALQHKEAVENSKSN